MKTLIYIVSIAIFITILSGCGESSNGENNIVTSNTKNQQIMEVASISLRANISNNDIHLTWETIIQAVSYKIEWGESQNSLYNSEVLDTHETEFIHTNLEENKIYYYRLVTSFSDETPDIFSKVLAVKTGDTQTIQQSDLAF